MVKAPVGCGKTTWALRYLAQTLDSPLRMLYLIDTVNGNDQIVSANSDIATFYSDVWFDKVSYRWELFSEEPEAEKIVVMTYAKFGALVKKDPEFAFGTFDYIICDEIHNLPKFMTYGGENGEDRNWYELAKFQLEEIVEWTGTIVIGLSATPERAEKAMQCPIAHITVDDDVFQLKTENIIFYSSKLRLLDDVQDGQKGLVYIQRISDMEDFCNAATERNIKAICIWSINSKNHPMSQEQLQARNHILQMQELPPQYDMVIINASSETSISIYGQVDYIIVHRSDEDTQIQVRGRYRNTLKTLYLLNYDSPVRVPSEFMDRDLDTEDKRELCDLLSIHDSKGRKVGWTTIKKKLIEAGYTITPRRHNSKRYDVISV